jgi:hypothetical protein
MNPWTLSYTAGCLIVAFGIYRARANSTRPAWLRLAAWCLASAACVVLVWSTLACAALPLLGEVGAPGSAAEWGACVAGSAYWASFVVAVALPFYGLLLTWYTYRFGRELGGWPAITRSAAVLGLPPACGLLYGYAFPAYNGAASSILRALPFALLGFAAAAAGLLIPRVVVRRLGPGGLVHPNAA